MYECNCASIGTVTEILQSKELYVICHNLFKLMCGLTSLKKWVLFVILRLF